MQDATQAKIVLLKEAVLQAFAEIASLPSWDAAHACVILSGGLDSAIVTEVGKDVLGATDAFTVLTTATCADRVHAATVAAAAGLRHHVVDTTLEDVLTELPHCVRVLRTFDPMTLRNDIAICRALREAAAIGITCAATGDGADEILGGYNFTHRLDAAAWEHNRRRMVDLMSFGSVALGGSFGIHVASPYTCPAVVAAALRLRKDECVGEVGGKLLGKLPLRRAFPHVTTCWRGKDPIEVGCGTEGLGDRPWVEGAPPGYFSARIPDAEFEAERVRALKEDGVRLRDKEHLAYYRVFRAEFPAGAVPGRPRGGRDACPACGYQLSDPTQTFCVTCGHYDADMGQRGGGAAES